MRLADPQVRQELCSRPVEVFAAICRIPCALDKASCQEIANGRRSVYATDVVDLRSSGWSAVQEDGYDLQTSIPYLFAKLCFLRRADGLGCGR